MDHQILIDEICRRVLSRMQMPGKRRKILLLEETDCTGSEILRQSLDNGAFEIYSSQEVPFQQNLDEYTFIIAVGISVRSLAKAANGIQDSHFLEILSNTFLSGRTVYSVKENIELLQYQLKANQNYYNRMESYLNRLVSFGLTIVALPELVKLLTDQNQAAVTSVQNEMRNSVLLDKKVITEGDLRRIPIEEIKSIKIRPDSILTDLAKDYIHKHQMILERNGEAGKKVSE